MTRHRYLGWDYTLLFPGGFKQVVPYRVAWGGCSDQGRALCIVLWLSPMKSFTEPQMWFTALSCPIFLASFVHNKAQTLIFRYDKMPYLKNIFHSTWSVILKMKPNFSSSGTFCSSLKLSVVLKLFEKTHQRENYRLWEEILCVKILILPDTPAVSEQNCSTCIKVIPIEISLLAWTEQLKIWNEIASINFGGFAGQLHYFILFFATITLLSGLPYLTWHEGC